jgi:hypothetical protein
MFTMHEIELLLEALAKTASRHESQARYNPRAAWSHDRTAAQMRELRVKLLKLKVARDAALRAVPLKFKLDL